MTVSKDYKSIHHNRFEVRIKPCLLFPLINIDVYTFVCTCVEQELLSRPRGEVLVEFVRIINLSIRDVQLEIKKAADEYTGENYYVLVCTG